MTRLTVKFNDTPGYAEHDWLVMDGNIVVAGFQGSNAAERFIKDRDDEARVAAQIFKARRAVRAQLAAEVEADPEDSDPAADRDDWRFHQDHDQ